MYVRWKRQVRTRMVRWWRKNPERVTYRAYLVESKRVDGKPRQHSIAYLGSIEEGKEHDYDSRVWFWRSVGKSIVPTLPADQRVPIEQKLQQRVPFPTREERERMEAAHREEMARIEARLAARM